ncbi:MAG: endopeptidase La [Thermoanaerobaculia bacterium]|nr:endopeptidase La [Thermoanaerobaculia bacterium]
MSETAGERPVRLPDLLPVLALRDTVIFPFIILPLSVGREKSVLAVDHALAENRIIMLVAQRDPGLDEPTAEDFHEIGTAALIMRMLKLPDGRIRILAQGLTRARIEHFSQVDPFPVARVRPIEEEEVAQESLELEALVRTVKESLGQAAELGRTISPEVMVIASNLTDPGRLADLVASNMELRPAEAQQILETTGPVERLLRVNEALAHEVQLLTMQQKISTEARDEMDRSQREYYLRQQLKAIQKELGDEGELAMEIAGYRRLAKEKELPPDALEEFERQIRRLERSHPDSAETQIVRGYLEWMTALPWAVASEDRLDLDRARQVLDEDHYGLEKIKERIIEYLAVRKLNPRSKGPILCFAGPPGTGKTSLGRSIARALDRKFVRVALGGVRDEAEIRGHRRTYVGALPGRVIQAISQAGVSNPVFMLDEIDKLGADYRGDPSSALLEVLDPEQNASFQDHYLGVPYDLSKVMFITTANSLGPIQPAFLDRMEVIRLSGYIVEEKVEIARRHLLPKLLAEHGLRRRQLSVTPAAIRRIVADYTKEAGVRNLERELASICRKVAVRIARGDHERARVTIRTVERFLGPARHFSEELLACDRVGVATGLAWTPTGGDLLFIEAIAVPGRGKLLLTGQLGEVMRESAQAALSYARMRSAAGSLPADYFSQHDLHIHVPAGSVPKDGPSAGLTIAAAIVSRLLGAPVDRRAAMTGEITLRGDVLPIGGLKEKVLAARGAGISKVILPKLNQRDLEEVEAPLRQGLTFHFVDHLDEALELALGDAARRLGEAATESAS